MNLEKLNVTELNAQEVQETEGGSDPFAGYDCWCEDDGTGGSDLINFTLGITGLVAGVVPGGGLVAKPAGFIGTFFNM
jgi:hypothetical protein